MNPVIQCIADRRSIRKYEDRAVEKETLDLLLNSAFSAPSAKNLQPWHLSVTQNKELMSEMNADIKHVLGTHMGTPIAYDSIFHKAPCLISIATDASNDYSSIDSGIMAQTIALAAHSLGLGSCIIGYIRTIFRPDENPNYLEAEAKYYERLNVPEGYKIGLAVVIGYPTKIPDARARERKLSFVE